MLALRVAPDGVRVALLIHVDGGGNQIVLSAIDSAGPRFPLGPTTTVGSNLADPISVSWYDADHLVACDRSELFSVPASDSPAVPIGPVPPGTESITAAGPGQIATAGHGSVMASTGPDQTQVAVHSGSNPVYQQ